MTLQEAIKSRDTNLIEALLQNGESFDSKAIDSALETENHKIYQLLFKYDCITTYNQFQAAKKVLLEKVLSLKCFYNICIDQNKFLIEDLKYFNIDESQFKNPTEIKDDATPEIKALLQLYFKVPINKISWLNKEEVEQYVQYVYQNVRNLTADEMTFILDTYSIELSRCVICLGSTRYHYACHREHLVCAICALGWGLKQSSCPCCRAKIDKPT